MEKGYYEELVEFLKALEGQEDELIEEKKFMELAPRYGKVIMQELIDDETLTSTFDGCFFGRDNSRELALAKAEGCLSEIQKEEKERSQDLFFKWGGIAISVCSLIVSIVALIISCSK